MHGKLVLLLLAALQVSYASQWERPHVKYYSRWAKHSQPDPYKHQQSNFEDSYDQPLNRDHCPHHSDDIKPVHEDQHEDVPSTSDSFLRDGDSAEDHSGADTYLHGRPRHDDCEILVNPIRPPYEGPNKPPMEHPAPCSTEHGCEIFVNPIRPPYEGPNKPPIEYPARSSSPTAPELPLQGVPEEEFQSHEAPYPETAIKLGASVSGGINQGIQASIANSAINQQISAGALRVGPIPENVLIAPFGPISPLLPFLPPQVVLPTNQPTIGPLLPMPLVPSLRPPVLPSPNFCIRHRLVPVPVRVVEDCITNVPVVRKTLRHEVQTVTRHVPVFEKTLTQQHEKTVRHVPVTGKTRRTVVETRVRHIPVIKSRTRTVVEPYTVHIPVTLRFTRPVEESFTKTVPVQEVRVRPVVTKRTRLVPIVERRLRPIVEQRIDNVPVRKKFLRTIVEQRVRPVAGPCQPCFVPLQPIGLPMSVIPAEEIPRILLSPYSDIIGAPGSTVNGGAVPGVLPRPAVLFASGPMNGHVGVPSGEQSGVPCQPIHINSGELRLRPGTGASEEIGIPPSSCHIIPNLHGKDCSPRPSSC